MAAHGPLPLAEFMASLSDLGIRATLDDQRRITLALRAGGPWTILQFRGVLSSLLVRDQDHVAEFRRRFDGFFDSSLKDPLASVDVERALAELRGLAEQPARRLIRFPTTSRQPVVAAQKPSMSWRWSVPATLALALLLQESAPPSPGTVVALPGSSTATQKENGKGAKRASTPAQTVPPRQQQGQTSPPVPVSNQEFYTYLHSPVLTVKAFHPPPAPPPWADPWLLAIAALSYSLWLVRWLGSVAQAPDPTGPPGGGPRLFRSGLVGGGLAPRLDRQTLDRMADALGYFRSEESGKDLDLQASVEKTVRNGGIPTPIFELRRQMRRVLILEDLHSEARAWNPIAQELSIGLSRRGVPVVHGLFAGVPDRFRSSNGLDQQLEDLEDERRGYLVLIFSDGKGLGPAEADFTLERLARWPQVAWMQLQDRRFWDQTAARPALRGLPIFPADRKGLLQVVAAFAMERAVREPTSSPESWRGRAPLPLEGSLKLYIEEILRDSLLWAQACAMAPPPIALGLADRLRERFHPGLPPERIERLLVLPGSQLLGSGLKLDQPVLAVLREGFTRQHGDQEAVLEFLLEQMSQAEPEDLDSLAHQAWEWRLERIRLELDPEPAVERLAALALGPLRETIRTDLGKVWSRSPDGSQLPLRIRPRSRYAAERLAALVKGSEISPQDLYRPRVWPEAGLAVAAVVLVALLLWRLSLPAPRAVSLSLARNTPGVTSTALVSIERQQGAQWVEVSHLSLDQNEVQSSLADDLGVVRVSAFLPGAGMARKVLPAPGPGTVTLELATERRTRACQERFPELGFVVTRCGRRVGFYEQLLHLSNLARALQARSGAKSPSRWIAQIGIEFTGGAPSPIGYSLLQSGYIDILYSISGPEPMRAAAVAQIQERWRPWAHHVRLFSWTPGVPQDKRLNVGSLADWPNLFPVSPLRSASTELQPPTATQEISETEGSRVAAVQETVTIASPTGDNPPVPEPIPQAPQNGADRGETPPADQSPACPSLASSRCGDACVDLKTNPFHYGACFAIAPSLSRAAAESVDSPPSWTDERIQPRRYYRMFYTWDGSKSSVIGGSLASQAGWNRGEAPDLVKLALSAAEVAGTGSALAITDLEIHCVGDVRVANLNSGAREMFEKLSTQSNWRSFGKQFWRGPEETSMNTGLARTLAPTLSTWEQLCKRER